MGKILVRVAAAALWFLLSHAANAEDVCRQVCDGGACVSKCVDHPDAAAIVRDDDRLRGRVATRASILRSADLLSG